MLRDTSLRAPIGVYLETTYNCNLRCFHCYSDSGSTGTELSTQYIRSVLDELREAGVFMLHFGGGEPLMRRDIFDLLRYSSQYFETSLVTNGTLVTKDKAKLLRDLNVKVGVSLDGPVAVHDRIRGVEGTFRRTIRGITCLVNEGISTGIIACVSKFNFHLLWKIVEISVDIGANSLKFTRFMPIGRGARHTNADLSPYSYKKLMSTIRAMQERYEDRMEIQVDENLQGLFCAATGGESGTKCSAARTTCTITADGHLKPCPALVSFTSKDSLLSKSFSEIWSGAIELRRIRELSSDKIAFCKDCTFLHLCGGCCRAASWERYGELHKPDPACWFKHPKTLNQFFTKRENVACC